jgi:hypothetical protein
MKFLFTRFVPAFLIFCFFQSQASDKPKLKWGKVDPSEFAVKDTSKNFGAIVLFDLGSQEYEVIHGELFLVYRRHTRIKILNKSGYDYASRSIMYEYGDAERIEGIEGRCYWQNEAGEILSQDMDRNLIFDENYDNIYHLKKFAVPGVKEGCIIEYKFKIVCDDIFAVRGWTFQWEIPVKYSELTNAIPRFFVFEPVPNGKYRIEETEVKNYTSATHIHTVPTSSDALNKGSVAGDYEISMEILENGYFLKDVPALEEEPVISSVSNYSSSIDFYLTQVNLPNGLRREYDYSWKFLLTKLYEREKFGSRLNENAPAAVAKNLFGGIADEQSKVNSIYKYVATQVQWNGISTYYAGRNLKSVMETHRGTSGEINLLLLNMLKAVGVNADPVLTSTRDNGYVGVDHPSMRYFNHVIVCVNSDKGKILLDATDPFRTAGNLDENHLNGSGLLAQKDAFEWIPLKNKDRQRSVLSANCTLAADGTVEITSDKSDYGYKASMERKRIAASNNADDANKKLSSSISDVDLIEHTFENVDSLNKQLKSHLKYKSRQFCVVDSQSLYLLPMIDFGIKENPFMKETRNLPVEYAEAFEEACYVNIKIPAGYSVKELPKSEAIKLPDNDAVFSYMISNEGDLIQLKCTLSVNATYIQPDFYPDVKEFFSRTLQKQKERIVLTKN